MRRRRNLRFKKQRGNALIELSIILPLLILLFLGTWSIGYSCYVYAELEGAVRSGARYGSVSTYDAVNPAAFRDAVKNVVVYGDPAGGTQPVISGLQTSHVNVTISPSVGQPTAVTISISGYQLFGPWANRFSLANKPWVEIPFLGNYIPA